MRKIYTYDNPLLMNKDKLIWDMISKYPQFCASDTLAQGMIQYYGRKEFGIIQTVNDLQKATMGAVTDDVQFNMQLFLDVAHIMRKAVSNEMIGKSFRNNINEVVDAIRYLLFLDAEPVKLYEISNVSSEQTELFNIYKHIHQKYQPAIKKLMLRSRQEIEKAIGGTIINEAKYVIRINKDYLNEDYHCNTLIEAQEKLSKIQTGIKSSIEERQVAEYVNTSKEKKKLERVEYAIKMIDQINTLTIDTIIIHGVHRFTPELLLTLKLLEQQKINVIFLIHYVGNLPQVYETWKEVYSWTNLDFINVKPLDLKGGSKTGRELAKIYSGELSTVELNSYKASYDNISELAAGDIRKTFHQASEELAQMKIQYYAVDNTEANMILKNYFPEQFEIKPFLSYPIGQFILGIYNMWDFDNSCMKVTQESLRECVVSGVFEKETSMNIAGIYDDIAPYIEGLSDVTDIIKRLLHLKKERAFIERNYKLLNGIQSICYFSRNEKEIEQFIRYIKLLDNLSNQIFSNSEEQISFNTHFKNLIEVLSKPFNNSTTIHKAEIQLVHEILSTLGDKHNIDVIGDYSDVKEALTFFLHQSNIDDSSNWIVRNFEQLDGAVLLADHTKAREYHFALLSMKNMTKGVNDELPWPLSEELFYGYDCELTSSIQANALSNKERSNFLKYSLFFATFFFRKKITFSYIKNQNDEKQRPYYIFDLLNLKQEDKRENADVNFESIPSRETGRIFDYNSLTIDQREIFAICKYKYFLNRVLNEPIVYRNDFQIKYFLQNYIVQVIMDDSRLKIANQHILIRAYIERFKEMFPNYDAIAFLDIERNVKKDVSKSLEDSKRNNWPKRKSDTYKRRKKNFLLAQWSENGTKEMDFTNISEQGVKDYMFNDDILLSVEDRPHKKICENCNYYVECLMKYYEGMNGKENEE